MSLPVHKDISPDFAFGLCHKHSCLLRVWVSLCVCISRAGGSRQRREFKELGSFGAMKLQGDKNVDDDRADKEK